MQDQMQSRHDGTILADTVRRKILPNTDPVLRRQCIHIYVECILPYKAIRSPYTEIYGRFASPYTAVFQLLRKVISNYQGIPEIQILIEFCFEC